MLALGAGGYQAEQLLLLGSTYHAKMLCSGVFVSGREASSVERDDISIAQHLVLKLIRARVDDRRQTVSAGPFGLAHREAVFREGLGCTAAISVSAEALRAEPSVTVAAPRMQASRLWPDGETVELQRLPLAIDVAALRVAVDGAFLEPNPTKLRRSRAVIVVYDGRIVAERYAPGFSAHMPLIGWSMTKSVTGALAGILVGAGKLALNAPAPVPEWRQPGDPRGAITLDQLLHMASGLEFSERYDETMSDVVRMLFAERDMGAYAAAKPLAAAPGTLWRYSTGTSSILARLVYAAAGDTTQEKLSFPRRRLFDRIGMTSAVLELDPSGTFAGSAFMYASARDWARLGLLYLRDGMWNGERILPPGWVKYSRTPTPPPPAVAADFGAHLWLRVPEPYFRATGERPPLPTDMFHFVGHHAQFVSVIPSRRLVVVRLGLSAPWAWDQEEFLEQVLRAVPERR